MSKWHQSSDRREQNDPAVHKVGSDPGSDPEMQNPFHSTWHVTCLLVRLPNLGTPNLVAQLGDQAPWHLLVRLLKLGISARDSLVPPIAVTAVIN